MNAVSLHPFSLLGALFVALAATANPASALADEILFESGTLGPTGLAQGSVEATNVSTNVYVGVRFELAQPVRTSEVGGHFVDRSNGTFFGAIVQLDDVNDFPNSEDLSTPDVLGTTTLTFPMPSAEVFGNLSLNLDPGWYGLVFGTGRFGTSADGAAPRNNTDIGSPSYFAFEANLQWFNLDIFGTFFDNHRFVVIGEIVPEPSASIILLLAILAVALQRVRRF